MRDALEEVVQFDTLEAFHDALQATDNLRELLKLGGCPCFQIEAGGVTFDGHCWRVCTACEYCGVHIVVGEPEVYRSDPLPFETAALLKRRLDEMDWYDEWTLSWEPR